VDLLRLATAGSVDDGKSTLIGRLLYDAKAVLADQLAHVEERSVDGLDLALLTDGLRAEREQGITIDVAYRYFSTPKRTFIIADTPGHLHYTRNMVTGASTADLAIVLVDARNGLVSQSRRHAYLAVLLGIPNLVLAVNKMDLVEFSQERFDEIAHEFDAFVAGLGATTDVVAVPISALNGDNVVDRSPSTPWYQGPTLLDHLERVEPAVADIRTGARLPVQYVLRPQTDEFHDYRGYAGTIAGGVLRPGDEVVVLPSGRTTTVVGIEGAHRAVSVQLADDLDVSRGDLIAAAADPPPVRRELDATLCWFDENASLKSGETYLLKHTTRTVKARVESVVHRVDVESLATEDADGLALNEIGRVRLRLGHPIFADPYSANRATGCFVLIDQHSNDTVAAGIVRDA
jgi:bifunctional enzyme CysN/CysC